MLFFCSVGDGADCRNKGLVHVRHSTPKLHPNSNLHFKQSGGDRERQYKCSVGVCLQIATLDTSQCGSEPAKSLGAYKRHKPISELGNQNLYLNPIPS